MSSSELARESVWDYPRPPRIEPCKRPVRIEHGGVVVAESERALRVLETASPPTIYIPRDDVRTDLLSEIDGRHTHCEWKGRASYCHVDAGGSRAETAAFFYPEPRNAFEPIRDHVSFYPGRVDAAFLGDERVRPQPGSFYAGWITDEIEGPFKGEPGTEGW
ncbi:MAG: DUF427 domain-containing protein [Solirubrobacterales bacterium]